MQANGGNRYCIIIQIYLIDNSSIRQFFGDCADSTPRGSLPSPQSDCQSVNKMVTKSTTSSIAVSALDVDKNRAVRGWSNYHFSLFFNNSMRLASLLLILYWSAIFIGTHLPAKAVPKMEVSDKFQHFGAYAVLAFLLAWAIPTRKGFYVRHAAITFGIVILYGCLDELTQYFVPGRSSSLGDLMADAAGALIGLGLYWTCRYFVLKWDFGRRMLRRIS